MNDTNLQLIYGQLSLVSFSLFVTGWLSLSSFSGNDISKTIDTVFNWTFLRIAICRVEAEGEREREGGSFRLTIENFPQPSKYECCLLDRMTSWQPAIYRRFTEQ